MLKKLLVGLGLIWATQASAGILVVEKQGKHQTIEGIGAALAMYSGWIPSHPYKDEIYDTIFKGTGISILRLGNWLQDTTSSVTDDSSIVSELHKRNPYAKVLVSSWSPPSYLKANNNLNGNNSPNSLKKVNGKFVYDQFGHWWKSSIRRYNAVGIKPDYITIQNEINWNTDYPSALFNPTENDTIAAYQPALRAVHDSIATLTQYPRILSPEVLGTGYSGVETYAKTMDTSSFYGWAFHFYGSGDFNNPPSFISNPTASFTTLMNTIKDKPRFMTEYCNLGGTEATVNQLASPDTAKEWLNLAWIMQEAFTVLNLNGWVFWDLAWGNTGSMVAVLPGWDRNSWTATTPHGYFVHRTLPALGQYSKFVRGGWVRIDATPQDTALKVSAFLSPNGDSISVIIVNPSYSSVTFTPLISGSPDASGDVWTTSSTQSIAKNGSWSSGKDLVVAARTVTTLNGGLSSVQGARFYQFSNYAGLNSKLAVGTYTLAQLQALGIPDNSMNSLKVDAGLTVELFDGDNFTSLLGSYQSDVADFSTLGIANKVTSLRISVTPPSVINSIQNRSGSIHQYSGSISISGISSGKLQVVDAAGRGQILEISEGKVNIANLPTGVYQAKVMDQGTNNSFTFRKLD